MSWFWRLLAITTMVIGVLIVAGPAVDDARSPVSPLPTPAPEGCSLVVASEGGHFVTIQDAVDASVAGDVICVRAGTYNEQVWIQDKMDLTVTAYPGEQPVIDGGGIALVTGLVYVRDSSSIALSNLTVRNSEREAILVRRSDHIHISDNHTDMSAGSGIGVWRSYAVAIMDNTVRNARYMDGSEEHITVADVHDFTVSGNEVYQIGLRNRAPGIDIKESSSDGIVIGNHIHDIEGSGIYLDAWDAGLEGTATLHSITVAANRVHDVTTSGVSIRTERGGTVEDVRVFNNVMSRLGWCGIYIQPLQGGVVRDVSLVNNTIYEANGHGGAGIYVRAGAENILIRNNISALVGPFTVGQIRLEHAALIPQVTADHNIVWGPQLCNQTEPDCIHVAAMEADPLFVDVGGCDLHISAQSPAIDAGSPEGAAWVDFDGVIRPQGNGYDIGAFEYTGEVEPTDTPRPTPPANTATLTATATDSGEWWGVCPGTPGAPICEDCPTPTCLPTPDAVEWWCPTCPASYPTQEPWGTPPAEAGD